MAIDSLFCFTCYLGAGLPQIIGEYCNVTFLDVYDPAKEAVAVVSLSVNNIKDLQR